MIRFYARVVVPMGGTPVQITTGIANPIQDKVHAILIQALKGNTGNVYIGDSSINRTTESGVYATLSIPTSNFIPSFTAAIVGAPAGIALKDFYIDADVNNEGVKITVLVS